MNLTPNSTPNASPVASPVAFSVASSAAPTHTSSYAPLNVVDLDFEYPESLVATERAPKSRVMRVLSGEPSELANGISDIASLMRSGDVLVLNDTKVLKRRIFTESGLEILFLSECDAHGAITQTDQPKIWQVLCPSSRWKHDTLQTLQGGVTLKLVSRGRPQVVEASSPLTANFFEQNGEMPLPPYIQKARGERHNREGDVHEYQTAWADRPGSLAAPTASLHFTHEDLQKLKSRGVEIVYLTLHVGLGTFLPITVENLDDHIMHSETAEISRHAWDVINAAKLSGHHVWALGTTVTRTLESAALGKLRASAQGEIAFDGATDLFIRPGYKFLVVDRLLTNFHQPQSTLLVLVAAFTSLVTVKKTYAWAIENKFRLFSYGDLSVWIN